CIGSTHAARRAGANDAAAATSTTIRTTPVNVGTSDGETPYNIPARARENKLPSTQPATQPTKVTPKPCARNCFAISRTRMPRSISVQLHAQPYARRAYVG